LFEAAWEDELEAMRVIIDKVTDVDDDDTRGRTAMHNAAWRGHTEVVKFLLEHGASTNKPDKHNRSPLLFATLGKSEETAKFLLDKMLEEGKTIQEINMKTKRNRTPLRQASSKGFTEIVETLLDKIDNPELVNTVDTRKSRSALHCASFRAKSAVVALLLKKGADSDLKDKDGKTALQLCHEEWAIQGTSLFEDTLSLLIDHDPATAAKDSLLTATAAVNGSKKILEKLAASKADLDQIDRYGWTPLLLARQFRHSEAEAFLGRMTQPTKWDTSTVDENVVTVFDEGLGLEHNGEGATSFPSFVPLYHLASL
jgi:ankyrin repeat protein